MSVLYLDCGHGAAGDMLSAALLELMCDSAAALARLNGAGVPEVEYIAKDVVRRGVRGTHLRVLVRGEEEHHEHHHGRGQRDIDELISSLTVPDEIKAEIREVYSLILDAESRVHGRTVDEVHLHEVGALDALADITAVCILMRALAPERIVASPINVGGGTVKCAHGVLPVPAPATALLLDGLPTFSGTIKQELCTPTGAALVRHFASEFGKEPCMSFGRIGYGMGSKELGGVNCLRAVLGEEREAESPVTLLECNLDDMTPETVAFALERLLDAGALDVWTTPITMKKSRSAVMLSCLCRCEDAGLLRDVMFRHTATLGIRSRPLDRVTLPRSERTEETPFGTVRVKSAVFDGKIREKREYDDLARIALERGIPLSDVK